MAYKQKQNAGRGNMPKTGRDIPVNMISPITLTDGPGDKKQKKKEDKGFLDTVSSAYKKAYTGGKGVTKGGGATGQGRPGSGSRKGNKDVLAGVPGAVKAGYNYVFGD